MVKQPAEQPTLDVYARESRLGDERQRSTTGQVEDGVDQVAERGAVIGEVLVDSGRSAWNPRVRRPGWDRLMKRLETGATGGVWVFDLARFSRRPIEGERLIEAAERGLVVLDSEDEYDLTTASGKKAFRDQLSSAAYESDRLSTRVQRGKRIKARRGEPNSSTRAFGRELDGSLREDEAELVRGYAAALLAGESQDEMIVELNAGGVPTAAGGAWTRAGLRQVFTRPSIAGLVEYRGVIVAELPGDAVLDRDTWEQVCALFAARRRGRPNSEAYLCSGIVRCGLCERALSGRPRKNMKPYPDGQVRRQYWCQPRSHDGGCGRISVDQRGLDEHVAALAVAILADPRHAAAVEAAAAVAMDKLRRLDTEIADCEHLAEELSARLGRGEIGLARHDAAVAPLDRRLARLRADRGRLADAPDPLPAPAAVAASRAQWDARWSAAAVPVRRRLIRQALRGRRLLVSPADRAGPRQFDPARIVLDG